MFRHEFEDEPRESTTYRGITFKSDKDLEAVADKIVNLLRQEELPIGQAKDVLGFVSRFIDMQILK